MPRKLLFLLFVLAFNVANAQQTDTSPARPSENSPYSFYGIGNLNTGNLTHLDQMGGMSTAYSDTYTINIQNPASYASLATTSFDVGMWAKNTTVTEGDDNINVWSGNLGYLSLAFPIVNPLSKVLDRNTSPWNFGGALTLKPVSSVAYNISSINTLDSGDTYVRNFKGSGGINEFVFGVGAKYNNFSLGTNARYMFGTIEKQSNVVFVDLPNPYNNSFATEFTNTGFSFDIGAQYDLVLNDKEVKHSKERVAPQILKFGLSLGTQSAVNSDFEERKNIVQSVNGSTVIDTISVNRGEIEGTMPAKFGAGVTYMSGTRIALGIDYKSTQWSKYQNKAAGVSAGDLNDSYKISVGGFYRPSDRSYSKFLKRVQYKFGYFYEKDYRKVNDLALNRQAVTFGLGFPLIYQRKFSQANIGIELGKFGNGSPIEENYFKINFGFSFGDNQWFIKRKYN